MKIRRSRPSIEWTQIPNAIARDYRISWRARGLLVELLSYPPGWETTIDEMVRRAQKQAQQTGGRIEGRDAMRQAAAELKSVGYLVMRKAQDERGRWYTDMEVTDAPLWELLSAQDKSPIDDVCPGRTDDGFPGVGFPGVGSPVVGEPGVSKKTERKKERNTPPPPVPLVPAEAAADAKEEEEEEEEEIPGDKTASTVPTEAVEWVRGLPWRRQPGRQQREHLAVLVAQAWAAGWTPDALQRELTMELEGVRSLYAVWAARLRDLPTPRPSQALSEAPRGRPEWCGACDRATRMQETPDGRPKRCPDCHPLAGTALAFTA